ncbi:hypothetical protein DB346_08975 [Verrucomicrobia bacterium LW23]|nr:hypothetical protein DB346_08975 [Verrucomicrobia bacterium LW23]
MESTPATPDKRICVPAGAKTFPVGKAPPVPVAWAPVGTAGPGPSSTRELPDYIPAVLHLEMARGVRNGGFVVCFLVATLLPPLLLLWHSFMAPRFPSSFPFSLMGAAWILLPIVILIVIPATGLLAVANEQKQGTLELTLMTRLTPYQILFGKWCTLALQILMLVSAALPYVVLRYYLFANVNPLRDLWVAACVVMTAMALCAIYLALGNLRGGGIAAAGALLVWLTPMLMASAPPSWRTDYPPLPILVLIAVPVALLYGTNGLASRTGSYGGLWLRFTALGMTILWYAMFFSYKDLSPVIAQMIAMGLLIFYGILMEEGAHFPPEARKGFWLFRPGWETGSLWVILAAALWCYPVAYLRDADFYWKDYCNLMPFIGALFFGFLIYRMAGPWIPRGSLWLDNAAAGPLVLSTICMAAAGACFAALDIRLHQADELLALCPPYALFQGVLQPSIIDKDIAYLFLWPVLPFFVVAWFYAARPTKS